MAPEEDLLCFLDYRGSRLGSFCEYLIHLPLRSHVVRQRDAREPTVLYIVYIYAGVGRKRRPREEGDHHPTRLEERHLLATHLGLGPSQSVAVEGDGSLEVAHTECEEAHPRFHCSLSFPCQPWKYELSLRKLPFHRPFAGACGRFSEVRIRHGELDRSSSAFCCCIGSHEIRSFSNLRYGTGTLRPGPAPRPR